MNIKEKEKLESIALQIGLYTLLDDQTLKEEALNNLKEFGFETIEDAIKEIEKHKDLLTRE